MRQILARLPGGRNSEEGDPAATGPSGWGSPLGRSRRRCLGVAVHVLHLHASFVGRHRGRLVGTTSDPVLDKVHEEEAGVPWDL